MDVCEATRVKKLSQGLLNYSTLAATDDGPSLLFVHGSWHGAWCFETYLNFFAAAGIGAAALDLRGHGGLKQDELFVASGQSEMADDVCEAVSALGRPAVVVGHSAGAAIAVQAASRLRLPGMVLLAPSPPAQVPGLKTLPQVPDGKPCPPPDFETARRRFYPNSSESEARGYYEMLTPESPTLLNDRRALRVTCDRTRISGPILVIAAGREDPMMHAEGQDLATARFFDAEYYFSAEAGHCFMLEAEWRREAEIILRWYRKHFPFSERP
ncbi:alpha/beta fold hydrolase [Notoacmeibacter marinus]|uniref:alpha/beta fold hydrolase n=1 Tax=Notoacmeibacter marinus TaxID=1876515 RepID=UPI0013B0676F|nr:alpha/beta hydrolase [Notoacmeibacter marinus]